MYRDKPSIVQKHLGKIIVSIPREMKGGGKFYCRTYSKRNESKGKMIVPIPREIEREGK